MTKLTEQDVKEIREVLAEVRRCLQELITIKKESDQSKAQRGR